MPTVAENGENVSVEETRKQLKWENDDYICCGHILNGMSDSLFDVYQNVESAKELCDALELKYMAKDASSKKFLVSDFNSYKMSDARPVMEQYNELLRIVGQFAQHNMKMDESISVSSIIDKLPSSWKDFRRMLKHKKEELFLVQLGSHLRIEESLRVQEGGKPKNKEAETSSINMMEESGSSKMKNKGKKYPFTNNTNDGSNKQFKSVCWICNKSGHFKRDCRAAKDKNKTQQNPFGKGSKDRGPSSHQEPNDSIAVHTVIESRDAIFGENRFSLIPRPKDLVPSSSGTKEGDDTFVLSNKSPTLRKSKRGRIEKSFRPDFQLYLVEGSRDEIGFQYSYCYHIDDEPRTFSEAMTSNNVIFWKEAVNDKIDSIIGNNTWFLTDLPPSCKPLGCKWIFKKKIKVDGTIDKLKARLVVQGPARGHFSLLTKKH
ncbi:Zinc finger CCHC-type superfamily [Arabidopsis suecica]|uniref:Zinc finger CCHC-type superfamily n=1 Tax=Arabidopsis suecica TaxID=45249 RepID=A0A8T2CRQ0_ARASU|nr:Zinc finger CCHC-type superfamily [Arabidopsis suecica]